MTKKEQELIKELLEIIQTTGNLADIKSLIQRLSNESYRIGFDTAFKKYANYKEDMGR